MCAIEFLKRRKPDAMPFLIIDSNADRVCLDVVLDEGSQNEICCFSVHLVH
jgi:hypothetical protein